MELFGTDFESGTIAEEDWLVIGAPCEVRRWKKQRWDAVVVDLGHAQEVVLVWGIAIGAELCREGRLVIDPGRGVGARPVAVGDRFPMRGAGGEYAAVVASVRSLVAVTVEYVTVSNRATGKKSRRRLYGVGELQTYTKRTAEGGKEQLVAAPWT